MEKVSDILFRALSREDIPLILEAFNKVNWPKSALLFKQYLVEQQVGDRIIWLAFLYNQFAGYITIKWQSLYKPFRAHNIPEMVSV